LFLDFVRVQDQRGARNIDIVARCGDFREALFFGV
jgi:hypothetical protein